MVIRRKPLPLNPECEYCSLGWLRIHTDYIQKNEREGEEYMPCRTEDLVHIVPKILRDVEVLE